MDSTESKSPLAKWLGPWLTDFDEIKLGTSFEEVTTGTASIAYEGFDYLPGNLGGMMNGGTGFAGPWSDAPPVNATDEDGISTGCRATSVAQAEPAAMVPVLSVTSMLHTAPLVNQKPSTTRWSVEPTQTTQSPKAIWRGTPVPRCSTVTKKSLHWQAMERFLLGL